MHQWTPHTLALADALVGLGHEATVIALGDVERGGGFYRSTAASHALVRAPPRAETLEERSSPRRTPGLRV